jgi:hypothetical protein
LNLQRPLFLTLASLAATTILLEACTPSQAQNPEAEEAASAEVARTIHDTAVRAAVSRLGAKICRQTIVGISERTWIQGVVTEIGTENIRVRITDPGRFPQTIGGALLAPGVLVWDTPLSWTPCK